MQNAFGATPWRRPPAPVDRDRPRHPTRIRLDPSKPYPRGVAPTHLHSPTVQQQTVLGMDCTGRLREDQVIPPATTASAIVLRATCIFLDHWRRWHDLRLKHAVPPDQRAYVDKIIQRLMLCHRPDGGFARYVCPDCEYELLVSRPRRRAKPASAPPAARLWRELNRAVRVDAWSTTSSAICWMYPFRLLCCSEPLSERKSGKRFCDCHTTCLAWSLPVSWDAICSATTLTSTRFSVESPALTTVRQAQLHHSPSS